MTNSRTLSCLAYADDSTFFLSGGHLYPGRSYTAKMGACLLLGSMVPARAFLLILWMKFQETTV